MIFTVLPSYSISSQNLDTVQHKQRLHALTLSRDQFSDILHVLIVAFLSRRGSSVLILFDGCGQVSVLSHFPSSDRVLLGLNPILNLVIFTIQQAQFPTGKDLGKEEETGRDTEEGHEREGNGNCLEVHDHKYSSKEQHLEESVHVDALLFHVLIEDGIGILAWLLEEEQEAVPELDSRQRGKTHEEEDSQKDRHRKIL